MHGSGHVSAVAGIIALLASAGFLMWAGEKGGNPYQKVGKAVGWIGIILSALLVVGSIYACIEGRLSGGCMKDCPMMQMMSEGRGMGPGMGMHRGMGKGRGMGPGMGQRGMGPGMDEGTGPEGVPPSEAPPKAP